MHNLDSSRIDSLDESGFAPDNDCAQLNGTRSNSTRRHKSLKRSREFKNVRRVTIMPVIYGIGDFSRPLFDVKGNL